MALDANWLSTALLVGNDLIAAGDATFGDQSKNRYAVTPVNGAVGVAMAGGVFARGIDVQAVSRHLEVAAAVFDPGTQDFTIELFVVRTGTESCYTVIQRGTNQNFNAFGNFPQILDSTGADIVPSGNLAWGAFPLNTLQYCAISRQGTTFRSAWGTTPGAATSLTVAGTSSAAVQSPGAGAKFVIGSDDIADTQSKIIAGVRITIGAARNISVMPSAPFPVGKVLDDDSHGLVTAAATAASVTTGNVATDGANELITVRATGDFGSTGGDLTISATGDLAGATWTPIGTTVQTPSPAGDFRVVKAWYTYASSQISTSTISIGSTGGGGAGRVSVAARAHVGSTATVTNVQSATGTTGFPLVSITTTADESSIEAIAGDGGNAVAAPNETDGANDTIEQEDQYGGGPSTGWAQRSKGHVAPGTYNTTINNTSASWGMVAYEVKALSGPSIDAQPTDQTGTEGSTATFTLTASGVSVHYQWQRQDPIGGSWSNVGTDSNSYTTSSLTRASDAGAFYRCVVTDANGTVTSNAVELTVTKTLANYSGTKGLLVGGGYVGDSYTGGDEAVSGHTIVLGQATETDIVQPLTHRKVHAVAQTSEADLAQTLVRVKRIILGQPAETDLAQPVAKAKRKALLQASETDLAQPVARVKRRTLGQAIETDLAQGVTHGITGAVAQASETDLAQAVTWSPKKRLINQATESDAAQAITRRKSKVLLQAVEADTAQALRSRKVKAIAQTTEADAAQPLARFKVKAVAQVSETDLAQPIARNKRKTLGQTSETDLAQPVARVNSHVVAVGQASETDSAQPVKWVMRRAVNQASETDLAQPVSRRKLKAIGQALETDLAQVTVHVKSRTLGQPAEVDSVTPVAHRKARGVAQVLEADLAQPVAANRRRAIGQATEADLARPISHSKLRIVGQAVEIDVVFALSKGKLRRVGQVSELDQALVVTYRAARIASFLQVYTVPAELRFYAVAAEARLYAVAPESRAYVVDAEGRLISVDPETRVIYVLD
jgi:hypothetical protein